ncbi:MAG: peptide ABC transporter substrate-binding protein [Chloroflexi bacterium]|nr:MAG: peptide ABC transporter substrate-binding protein [Chloroflexota bacterium]
MESSYLHRGFALAVTATIALAACTQPGTSPSAAPSGSAAPVAQRGAGGELKILYWQAPTILNPHQATGTKDNDASRLVLEPLASWDKNGAPLANGLASEIPTVANGGVAKDFTSVTWKLRTGVKWSDGTPFTADDVVASYTYQCDEAAATSTFDVCTGVKSVTAKDPNTAVVTYSASQPFYYQWGVGFNSPILQKAQYANCLGAKAKDCPADLKPIGTGPYKVNTFKPGDTVLYDLNENFRDPNKPFFKTVTFKGGGDAASAARAVFQTGDIDYGWNLQVEASVLKPMAANSTLARLLTAYGSSVERLLVNFSNPDPSLGDKRGEPDTKHPFFSDIHVRRALAMATNRSAVAAQLYGDGLAGKATCNLLTAPEPMNSKNTDSLDVCKFDLNAANKELDDAGWAKGSDGIRAKGGVKLKIVYQTTVNSVRQSTQAILKADWEKVGFSVELKSVPAATFFTNTSPDGANHFWADVEMFTNSGDPDPTSYLSSTASCKQATGKANNWNFGNYMRYCNADYDKIIDQLRTETDTAKRNQLAIQANDILTKDVAVIPLITRVAPTPDGVSKALKGVDPSPWDSAMYNIADWSK